MEVSKTPKVKDWSKVPKKETKKQKEYRELMGDIQKYVDKIQHQQRVNKLPELSDDLIEKRIEQKFNIQFT